VLIRNTLGSHDADGLSQVHVEEGFRSVVVHIGRKVGSRVGKVVLSDCADKRLNKSLVGRTSKVGSSDSGHF